MHSCPVYWSAFLTHPFLSCRAAAWAALSVKWANLFGPVSKILGDKASFTSSLTAGELAIAVSMSFATDVEATAIDAFPNLVAFFQAKKPLIDKALVGYALYFIPK